MNRFFVVLLCLPLWFGCTDGKRQTLQSNSLNSVEAGEVVTVDTLSSVGKTLLTRKDWQKEADSLLRLLDRRIALLTDSALRRNICGWSAPTGEVSVVLIWNTPGYQKRFRQQVLDSPLLRFSGSTAAPNPQVASSDTFGLRLFPEYNVYSTRADRALFILQNLSTDAVLCGEGYSVTYEDAEGVWRDLPVNPNHVDIGYVIPSGGFRRFEAALYPEVHPNRTGRYRFFYPVSFEQSRVQLTLMTEFRLTDRAEELEKAHRTLRAVDIQEVVVIELPNSPPAFSEPDDGIYQVVEEMPEFPGGMSAALQFIASHIRYPEEERQNGVEGRVIVQMVIAVDGSVTQTKVMRSVTPALDKEALRVIGLMPKWKPGRMRGKAVKVMYVIPVTFRLSGVTVP